MSDGKPFVAFINAGEDDAMEPAHHRTCHTAFDILKKMESTGDVTALDAVKSPKDIDSVCEACVDG